MYIFLMRSEIKEIYVLYAKCLKTTTTEESISIFWFDEKSPLGTMFEDVTAS